MKPTSQCKEYKRMRPQEPKEQSFIGTQTAMISPRESLYSIECGLSLVGESWEHSGGKDTAVHKSLTR